MISKRLFFAVTFEVCVILPLTYENKRVKKIVLRQNEVCAQILDVLITLCKNIF